MITMSAGSGTTVDCSVLVPVRDEERHIESSLAAMRAQRFDGQLEFIFADGASTDRTRAILEAAAAADPRIRIYANPRRTVTSGLNVALGHACGRWVARMDAHTRYPDDYLARGVARLRAGDTRWVSGPQLPRGDGPVSRAVSLALGTGLGRSGSRKWAAAPVRDAATEGEAAEYELDAGVFTGVWERTSLLEYGGWDERWRVNEDSEMAGRFLARGERLICIPAMAATYAPRDSLPRLWRQYFVYGEYRARTARRHPETMRRQHLVAPALALTAAVAAAGPRSRGRAVARLALGLYTASIGREGVRALPIARPRGDAALVPVALATMHLAWGAGTVVGMARFGPPPRWAVLRLLGIGGGAPPMSGDRDEPVHHPSLTGV
jgi:succinoglycan biosynthesis protein ExoA